MDKTLKEIADELKIDKQKVYRFVKANDISEVSQNNSKLYYDEVAQEQIKRHFEVDKNASKNDSDTHNDTVNDALIDALLKQLEVKDKQINDIQNLLSQEQQLRMIEHTKLLEIEQKMEEQSQDQTKKHWWSFK